MNRKIKLIWDFRASESALKIAEDHVENLQYFINKNKSSYIDIGTELLSDFHAICFLIVKEEDMLFYRDNLKPHRATVAQ